MSYFDDYGSSGSKIPYDDVPITRNENARRSGSGRSRSRMTKTAPSFLVSLGLIINLLLSVVCFILVSNKKYRTINNYVLDVGSGSEVSMAVKSMAISSTICVTSTSSSGVSTGAGVIYKVVRNSSDPNSAAYNKGTIYFVTCHHVINNYAKNETKNVKVQLSSCSSDEAIKVSVAGSSSKYDLAVLKYSSNDLDEDLWGCSATTIFDSTYAAQGEQIFAVGNPLGLGVTITDGLISQLNAIAIIEGVSNRCLQISAEINPGNSGGGLFNSRGELIGIVNAKIDEAGKNETFVVEGTSYAIPSSIVRGVAEQIISGSSVVKRLNLNATFINDSKKTRIPYVITNDGEARFVDETSTQADNVRLIDSYVVKVLSLESSHPSNGLVEGDIITKIVYTDVETGQEKTQIMFNQYSFDDCVLSIKENTIMKFYIEGREESVQILAKSSYFVAV